MLLYPKFACIPYPCFCLLNLLVAVQALSNTVWSFSKLGQVHNQLLDTVAAVTLRKLSSFNAQNIANTVSLNRQRASALGHMMYLRPCQADCTWELL